MRSSLFLSIFCLTWGVMFLVPFPVSAATLQLEGDIPPLTIGDTFEVRVLLQGGEETFGTDVVLKYDPELLSVVSVAESDLYPNFNPPPEARWDEASGRVFLSGTGNFGTPVMAAGEMARVQFAAKSPGQGEIALQFEPGATNVSGVLNQEGEDLLTTVSPALTVSVTGARGAAQDQSKTGPISTFERSLPVFGLIALGTGVLIGLAFFLLRRRDTIQTMTSIPSEQSLNSLGTVAESAPDTTNENLYP